MCISAPTRCHLPDPPLPPGPREMPGDGLKTMLEQMVARVFDVELDLMQLPTRGRAQVAMARQVAMYLAHVACGLTLTRAGELFGRDRTTVAHACHVVEDRREDPSFDRALELLERVVRVLAVDAPREHV